MLANGCPTPVEQVMSPRGRAADSGMISGWKQGQLDHQLPGDSCPDDINADMRMIPQG